MPVGMVLFCCGFTIDKVYNNAITIYIFFF